MALLPGIPAQTSLIGTKSADRPHTGTDQHPSDQQDCGSGGCGRSAVWGLDTSGKVLRLGRGLHLVATGQS